MYRVVFCEQFTVSKNSGMLKRGAVEPSWEEVLVRF